MPPAFFQAFESKTKMLYMALKVSGYRMSKFEWVVNGDQGPNPACDRPVLQTDLGLVIPSVGSLVPGWLLVVPKQKVFSYAELPQEKRLPLFSLAKEAADKVSEWGSPIFLEHGSTAPNSLTGCGVDQAHLHVVPTDIDLLSTVLRDSSVKWERGNSSDPWSSIPTGKEYYLISVQGVSFVGYPSVPVSQYFRKHLANAIGTPDEWDYKGWPNYGNVSRTVEQFGSA